MKARLVQTVLAFKGGVLKLGAVSSGASAFVLDDPDNDQSREPVRAIGYYEQQTGSRAADELLMFVYRNRAVVVDPPFETSFEEIVIAVKHAVLTHEKTFTDMRADIERLLRLPDSNATPREPIPADVRMFVWRRDEGRCVRCDSNQRLEFDHIIHSFRAAATPNGTSNFSVKSATG